VGFYLLFDLLNSKSQYLAATGLKSATGTTRIAPISIPDKFG